MLSFVSCIVFEDVEYEEDEGAHYLDLLFGGYWVSLRPGEVLQDCFGKAPSSCNDGVEGVVVHEFGEARDPAVHFGVAEGRFCLLPKLDVGLARRLVLLEE